MHDPVCVEPDWPVPPGVRVVMTTRKGGVSEGPWAGLNLATHVGDAPANVARNRKVLEQALALPAHPCWLEQVHGVQCLRVTGKRLDRLDADAAWTNRRNVVLAVMVADCLPVCLASADGSEIAVVHAGWRGLAAGVIESSMANFTSDQIVAWMGPAIGPCHYEVDEKVREAFTEDSAFLPGRDESHWMLDLYEVARHRLTRAGVTRIFGGGLCTWCERDRFYSYRRDGQTGRMAVLAWKGS